jgi:two-component system, cell cycle sensor histidine kinase and response regulator CckA
MSITEKAPIDDRALLALLPDAVFALDADGCISRWTRGAEQIYGFTSADALGRGLAELLHSRLPHPLPELLSMVASAGSWRGMVIQRTKSGRPTSVESRWTAHYDQLGTLRGILTVDRSLSAGLQDRGGRQGRPLAAGIAHDFNNLLMVISNYATMIDDQLKRMQDAADQPRLASLRGDVGQIQDAAARAVRLNRQLSALSRRQTDAAGDWVGPAIS